MTPSIKFATQFFKKKRDDTDAHIEAAQMFHQLYIFSDELKMISDTMRF